MISVFIYDSISGMTTIHETIKNHVIEAMRAKDSIRLDTLRGLIALFSNELIAQKSTDTFLNDESTLTLIRRSVKQHKDSIEQFTKGGRMDLVEKEALELKVLEAYLPAQMSAVDIEAYVQKKISETGPIDPKKMGQFMGGIMKDLKGKADGSLVKTVIEKLLA